MNLVLDANVIVQGVMVAVLAGIAKAVWNASITIAAVATELKDHKRDDERIHEEVRQDIRDLRARQVTPSGPSNGRWS